MFGLLITSQRMGPRWVTFSFWLDKCTLFLQKYNHYYRVHSSTNNQKPFQEDEERFHDCVRWVNNFHQICHTCQYVSEETAQTLINSTSPRLVCSLPGTKGLVLFAEYSHYRKSGEWECNKDCTGRCRAESVNIIVHNPAKKSHL